MFKLKTKSVEVEINLLALIAVVEMIIRLIPS